MTRTADRPFLGILFMLSFCFLVPLSDAMAKMLGDEVSLLSLVALRFVFPILLWPLVVIRRHSLLMPRDALGWMALRTALLIAGMALMFTSLTYLPLADAVAIAFVAPFIQLYLGHAFLGEHVGPHRIGAAGVGFVGTMLVIQPNFLNVGAPALLPLGVAVTFALFALATRKVSKRIDPIAMQVQNGLLGMVVLLPLWLIFDTHVMPEPETAGMLLLFGTIGTVSALMMTLALKHAPSTTLAPMQYIEIPVATAIGWWVFRDIPNGLAAVGITITMLAGLYIIAREHRQAAKPQ